MNVQDIWVLSPYIALGVTALAVMLGIAVRRCYVVSLAITLLGLCVTLFLLTMVAASTPRDVTALLIIDRFSLLFTGLITSSALAVALLSYRYFGKREHYPDEFFILLLLAALGASVMPASKHFFSFYLGLEVLSVSLYAMIAFCRENLRSTEASIKYLIIAAGAAAFLLFGMALVYAQTGTMAFAGLTDAAAARPVDLLLMAGLGLILAGLAFKLSLVPFHMWTPDVYEGAPAPVTAYIATVSKAAIFGVLLRYFLAWQPGEQGAVFHALAFMAVASMLVGNLLALSQTNVKRVLAYSSISHVGYVLVAFLAGGEWGRLAVVWYLITYVISTLGAFGAVTQVSRRNPNGDCGRIEDYRGLLRRDPVTAVVLILMLLSLAGIPLTAGFAGKLSVIAVGVQAGSLWLLAVLVISSAIGLYYYLRIAYAICAPSSDEAISSAERGSGGEPLGTAVLCGLTVLLVWVGAFPAPWIRLLMTIE